MEDAIITDDAVLGGDHMTSAGAESAGATEVESFTLAELNQALGKNFTSKDAALKSWKDTYSFVGKREEDIRNKVLADIKAEDKTAELSQELQNIRKDMFYRDNPKVAPYRSIIEKIGGDPAQVVNTPEFKEIIEKASGFDEIQSKKTVLESNPKLVAVRDNLSKAAELKQQGAHADAVETAVARAVLGLE